MVVFKDCPDEILEIKYHSYSPSCEYETDKLYQREKEGLHGILPQLEHQLDVLVMDGNGVIRPDRDEVEAKIGREIQIPTFGIAKGRYLRQIDDPGPKKGEYSLVYESNELCGCILRTVDNIRPCFRVKRNTY